MRPWSWVLCLNPHQQLIVAKILKYFKPHSLTFLRMKLGCHDVIAPDGGAEAHPVIGSGQDVLCPCRDHPVRMHKVYITAIFNPAQQRTLALYLNLVPPHMRNLQRLAGHLHIDGEMLHGSRDNPETSVGAELLAAFKQNLQPQTDPQKGARALDMGLDRLDKSPCFRFSMQSPNAPTPGSTRRSARSTLRASSVTSALNPRCSNALCTLRRFPIP